MRADNRRDLGPGISPLAYNEWLAALQKTPNQLFGLQGMTVE